MINRGGSVGPLSVQESACLSNHSQWRFTMAKAIKTFRSSSEKPKNASFWYESKPGKNADGNNLPNISGTVQLTPEMVKEIIAIGELAPNELIEISVGGWTNDFKKKDTHPTHRGYANFRKPKENKQSKSA